MPLKLGKKPARPGAFSHQFAAFFSAPALPKPPLVFGKPGLLPNPGMLANDRTSDCVWADCAHQVMYWNALANRPVPYFNDAAVLSDYAKQTGYDPGTPDSDAGTDLGEAAAYWRDLGVIDAAGERHRIDMSATLRPGDVDGVLLATYLFGAVSVGIQLPESAQEQFDRAEVWSPPGPLGAINVGGHCITVCGRNSHGNILAWTWGRLTAMTREFLAERMDEAVVHLSHEMLRNNDKLSARGYDRNALLTAMGRL